MLKIDSQTNVRDRSQVQPLNARVIDRQDLTERLTILRISYESGDTLPFKAGQFVKLGIVADNDLGNNYSLSSIVPKRNQMVQRAYSICSSPAQTGYLEFLIDLVPHGNLTPKLWRLNKGDRLWMEPRARGKFTLDGIEEHQNIFMVCTGTGIAPFISMLSQYVSKERWNRLVLVHGARNFKHLAYYDEILALAQENISISYIPLLSREPDDSDWQGCRGRVQRLFHKDEIEQITNVKLNPERSHAYICGNTNMIKTMTDLLGNWNFTKGSNSKPGNIHSERYW
ncbi:MAG: ferredoxin--NADP reductase [Candidatus Electryonea clarkiae]|nr:ferredoxin--NADP reductase [Candidatus Electryonea clarkiae]MDP8289096.1 ferredoxin--NADP reductase [Candidatus Electryonea clarkiae]